MKSSAALLQISSSEFLYLSGLQPAEKGELYAPYFFEKRGWWKAESVEQVGREELLSKFESGENTDFNWSWQEPNRSDFEDCFESAKESFRAGDLEKIVPVVFAKSKCAAIPINKLMTQLLKPQQGLFAYAFWNEDEGLFGLTPEWLFVHDQGELRTMALAGTRPKNSKERLPLLEDVKERKEHQIVSDEVYRNLQPLADVKLSAMEVLELPTLEHLLTKIKCRLKGEFSFEEMVAALHPTPALGGFPREESIEQLKIWNAKFERHRFGAPFGVHLSDGRAFAVVAIRNIQFAKGEVLLGSGCGLVAESELDREWNELQHKRQSVLSWLGAK